MAKKHTHNHLLVFTAPSGSGKTTIVKHLLSRFPDLAFSVSATNRRKRETEKHGEDYYFLSTETFRMWIEENAFVEWEEVYTDQYYGTLTFEIERLWALGKHVIFDIDVKGATAIKSKYPEQTTVFYIKVPTLEQIIDRLRLRDTESPQSLKRRIDRIKTEMTYAHTFDHIVINEELEVALKNVERLLAGILQTNPTE